jgi:hypothetical protein
MAHEHDWIDGTTYGDMEVRLFCNCGLRAWQTFAPVDISTEDEVRLLHRRRIVYNDGSRRTVFLPVPMQVRPYLPIRIVDQHQSTMQT